jgi:hypothetical protein
MASSLTTQRRTLFTSRGTDDREKLATTGAAPGAEATGRDAVKRLGSRGPGARACPRGRSTGSISGVGSSLRQLSPPKLPFVGTAGNSRVGWRAVPRRPHVNGEVAPKSAVGTPSRRRLKPTLDCHSTESAVAFGDTNSVGIAGTDFKLSGPDLFEF